MRTKATRSRPFLIAASVGSVVAASLVLADYGTLDELPIRAIEAREAPKLDGVMDEAMWKTARPVTVRTMQGVGLSGLGESKVEIRAVHDDKNIYFAFRWEDPSRSLRRLPLIKKEDGWHILGNNPDTADVTTFYEDKFAVLFSPSDGFGNGGSTHMGEKPLGDKPAPLNRRGYHYTTDGSTLDMWQWKASRGGLLGYVDDMYISTPTKPSEMEAAGRARYQAGYWGDPGVPPTPTTSRSSPATRVRRRSSACRRTSPPTPPTPLHLTLDTLVNGPKPIAPSTRRTVSIASWVEVASFERSVIARSFHPGIELRSTVRVLSASSRRTTRMRRSVPPTSFQFVILPA